MVPSQSRENDDSRILPELMPSAVAALADVPFDAMDANEIASSAKWLESSMHRWPMCWSRRTTVSDAGYCIALRGQSRVRPVVPDGNPCRCAGTDKSCGLCPCCSVRCYQSTRDFVMVTFSHDGRLRPDPAMRDVRLSTSLTRLTPTLALRSAEQAIERATDEAVDRYGGTHLATSPCTTPRLRHGNALRGGATVIASDGWDSDPPEMKKP